MPSSSFPRSSCISELRTITYEAVARFGVVSVWSLTRRFSTRRLSCLSFSSLRVAASPSVQTAQRHTASAEDGRYLWWSKGSLKMDIRTWSGHRDLWSFLWNGPHLPLADDQAVSIQKEHTKFTHWVNICLCQNKSQNLFCSIGTLSLTLVKTIFTVSPPEVKNLPGAFTPPPGSPVQIHPFMLL